ncbi:MAG TPA: fibronectin type III domain-containing protein [Acidimicrobiales bacterium]|nr:fibronectin type III domain-containing protein [Acidimicrobiales bacterium]
MAHNTVGSGPVAGGMLLALILTLVGPIRPVAAAPAPADRCGGLVQLRSLTGEVSCSHPPDAAPPGIDIKSPRPPVPANRAAGAVPAAVTPICTGDGTSGPRVQLVYARPAGRPDRYDAYSASFLTWAAQVDAGLEESAEQTGGSRRIRFVHDGSCTPTITRVVVTAEAITDGGAFNPQIRAAHGNPTDRRFLVWMDATEVCGVAEGRVDDRPDWKNRNNGPESLVARVDSGCWGIRDGLAEGHELFHTLGAVQQSAPHSTPGFHCTDEIDRMCGFDGSGLPVTMACPGNHEDLFDCNHDDYFHTDPAPGSYLATHWNTADSRFFTGPPAAPSDVGAVGTEASAVLSWSAAMAGAPDITGFQVKTIVDGVVGPAIDVPAGATSYTPTTLPGGAGVRFTVAAKNEYGVGRWSPPTPAVIPADGSRFLPLAPARILDTRSGNGAPVSRVQSAATLDLQVTGRGGVPATGVSAVALNVTVTEPWAGGYLTVWPTGDVRPLASNLNVDPGQTVANLVTVKVGAGGKVSIFNGAGVNHLVADVAGWYGPTGARQGSLFQAVAPARLLDTRSGNGAPAGRATSSTPVDLQVAGRGGVPATGVSAVVLNVTVTEPVAGGFVTVWPAGESRPLASNLNFTPGQTVPNLVTVKVGAGGKVSLYHSGSAAHLVADVAGWFGESAGARYHPVLPARVLDTRPEVVAQPPIPWPPEIPLPGYVATAVAAGQAVDLQVAGAGGVPADGPSAVILNVTAVDPMGGGFLTVWPTGQPRPLASNLNFVPKRTAPNLVVAKLGAGGKVSIHNGSGNYVHLVADVAGWYGPA